MIHDFGVVWTERSLMLSGLANTVILSVLAAVCALFLGAMLAMLLLRRNKGPVVAARVFVDAMRCTPFLLFAYIVYYGLPSVGISFDNWSSGLLALTRNRSCRSRACPCGRLSRRSTHRPA